jgi:hypothetical protein
MPHDCLIEDLVSRERDRSRGLEETQKVEDFRVRVASHALFYLRPFFKRTAGKS